MQKMS